MKYYNKLDFPPIPEELLNFDFNDTSIYTIKLNLEHFDYGVDHYLNGEYIRPPKYVFHMIDINRSPLKPWLDANLPFPVTRMGHIAMTHSDNGRMIVHTDRDRRVALNYIIDAGGDNVITNWYQEEGMPVFRERKVGGQAGPGKVDYEKLTLLDSTVFKERTWGMIHTDILHDVININSTRRILSFGFDDYSYVKN